MQRSIFQPPSFATATSQFTVDGETITIDARSNSSGGEKPDLVVKTSAETLDDLLARKIKPQQAFMKGKLKIKGKMSLAMKLQLLLDATRKNLASKFRLELLWLSLFSVCGTIPLHELCTNPLVSLSVLIHTVHQSRL